MYKKNLSSSQKGVIHLAVPLLLLIVGVAALFILASLGVIKNPFQQALQRITKQEPNVSLQKQYQNPFDKGAQYINPFTQYKNPFDALKQAK